MRIVVVGGTGLIGRGVVARLTGLGHEAVPASPSSGVDTLTGAGVAGAVAGADVVVDVTGTPDFAHAREFFETSTRTLLAAEAAAGVGHHVLLSIVGVDRAADSPYLAAKLNQEKLVTDGGVPYTIVRATQFFEFLGGIADASTQDGVVRVTSALFQPIAAAEVSLAVADAAVAPPAGILEVAGPAPIPLSDAVRQALESRHDPRAVVGDRAAGYFGALIDDTSIVPGPDARLGTITLTEWLG
jgi:uncharacterized protein YbjT (DUF2867 family)